MWQASGWDGGAVGATCDLASSSSPLPSSLCSHHRPPSYFLNTPRLSVPSSPVFTSSSLLFSQPGCVLLRHLWGGSLISFTPSSHRCPPAVLSETALPILLCFIMVLHLISWHLFVLLLLLPIVCQLDEARIFDSFIEDYLPITGTQSRPWVFFIECLLND